MRDKTTFRLSAARGSSDTIAAPYRVRALVCAVAVASGFAPARGSAQNTITTSGAQQISIGINSEAPNGFSSDPAAAPNRDLIVFASRASNLVSGDTNQRSDIFQYTPENGLEVVNKVATTGQLPLTGDSFGPAVSPVLPDGSYAIAFISDATDFQPGYQSPVSPTSNPKQVYIRIPKTNETLLVSAPRPIPGAPPGTGANADCDQVSLTALANPTRYIVAFRSSATNLDQTAPNNGTPRPTIFLATLTTIDGKTILTTLEGARSEQMVPFQADLGEPAISGNGRLVAFSATGAVQGFESKFRQIYLYDRFSKKINLISRNSAGAPSNGDSAIPALSFQGEKVVFISKATDIVPNSTGKSIALEFDARSNALSQVNLSASGEASNGDAQAISLGAGGKVVAFTDTGTNLVSTPQTDGRPQTYVKELRSGAVILTSVNPARTAGDGASGVAVNPFTGEPMRALSLGSAGFNTPTLFSTFRSEAPNLTGVGTSSPDAPNVFRAEVLPPRPPLTPNTPIEAPPDVTIQKILPNGQGARVRIELQAFSDLVLAATDQAGDPISISAATKLNYKLEIRKVGAQQRIFRSISRNTTTINKLTPGTYSIRYRVTKGTGSTTVKSKYSPLQSFEVPS